VRPPKSRTFGDLIDENAEHDPDHLAVIHPERSLTYGELAIESLTLAQQFSEMGIQRRDKVAILACNRPFWIVTAVATGRLGATLVPFNTWSKSWDLQFLLENSSPKILISMDRFLKYDYLTLFKEFLPEVWESSPGKWRCKRCPELKYFFILGDNYPKGAQPFSELVGGRTVNSTYQRAPGEWASALDNLFLLYTSGSTARPKGVVLKHYGCIENGFNIGERIGLQREDRVWLALPLFWAYGATNAMMTTFTHGATLVIEDTFMVDKAVETIEGERCTHLYLLPNIIHALVEHPRLKKGPFPSLRGGITIGKPDEVRMASEILGARNIVNVYGSSETYGNCAVTWYTDPLEKRVVTQGPPLPGNEIRIVSIENEIRVEKGQVGEVQVKGYVTERYFKDEELNAKSFTEDHFFRTGDLGSFDESGRFSFFARENDMIKTGGINVSPLEVEEFLATHPKIQDVVVVGVPHRIKGELIFAFVRRKEYKQLDEQELKTYAGQRIANFKIPHVFVFTDDFPKTDTGKVSRRMLIERGLEELNRRGLAE
jgi:fatty-acyl-CoA synthase